MTFFTWGAPLTGIAAGRGSDVGLLIGSNLAARSKGLRSFGDFARKEWLFGAVPTDVRRDAVLTAGGWPMT